MSEEIANGILKANGAAPTAVFLAGGGCQIPGFCQAIATELKIPFENVAISGNQPFKNVAVYDKNYKIQSLLLLLVLVQCLLFIKVAISSLLQLMEKTNAF